MNKSFLSIENFNTLGSIIENFIYDTYNISLKSVFEYDEFKQILRNIMNDVDQSNKNKNMSIADKNKIVIVYIRNLIFEKIKKQTEQSDQSTQSHPNNIPKSELTLEPSTELRSEIISKPETKIQHYDQSDEIDQFSFQSTIVTPIATPIMDRDEIDNNQKDEVFFKKLQDLEQRRKINIVSNSTTTLKQNVINTLNSPTISNKANISGKANISNVVNTSTILSEQPQQQLQSQLSPQSQTQQVIVAIPPPPRHGTSYIISSWDRSLMENPERANFVWTNSFPTMIDPLGTRIAGIFLPILVCNYTPYVVLTIEGASGINTSCILAPDNYMINKTRGWLRWSPMDDSLSYIKNVATPWRIQLRSADNTILPLGRDNFYIASINVDITNKSARLTLSPPPQEGEFQAGDQVWIYTKNERKKSELLSISNDTIEVRYSIPIKSPTMSTTAHEWINAKVLNYTRQWSMILDLTSSEHKKN